VEKRDREQGKLRAQKQALTDDLPVDRETRDRIMSEFDAKRAGGDADLKKLYSQKAFKLESLLNEQFRKLRSAKEQELADHMRSEEERTKAEYGSEINPLVLAASNSEREVAAGSCLCALEVLHDGRVVTSHYNDGHLTVWDPSNRWRTVRTIANAMDSNETVMALCALPDRIRLAVSCDSDGTVRIVDVD
jgi:hypothetical protein